MTGMDHSQESSRSRDGASSSEFKKNAVMSPDRSCALTIEMPSDWKLDPNSNSQPVAWLAPDNNTAVIVFVTAKGGGRETADAPLKILADLAAEVIFKESGEDKALGGAARFYLKHHSRMGGVEIYEAGGVIEGKDCDFLVKVVHSSQRGSIDQSVKDLVNKMWANLGYSSI